jgi:hypothetical protein
VSHLPEAKRDLARSQVYEPRQIKGLERKIVLVHGLDTALEGVHDLTLKYNATSNLLPALKARNQIDSVRVALSRSTHMVVIVERDSQQIVQHLGIDGAEIVDWGALRQRLQEADRDLTAFDKIHTFLRNAEESLQRDDYERARQQNQQAEQLLAEVADEHLSVRVRKQKGEIERALTRQQLVEALEKAEELRGDDRLVDAYEAWHDAQQLCAQANDAKLETRTQVFWEDRQDELNKVANEYWKRGIDDRENGRWSAAGSAYQMAADIRRHQQSSSEAEALDCLAERYRQLPPPVQGEQQVNWLLDLVDRYLASLLETERTDSESARRFVDQWLTEAVGELGEKASLYLRWAKAASEVGEWGGSDLFREHPDFTLKAVEAAKALRQLGMPRDAIELLNLVKEDIPEDLVALENLLSFTEGNDWKDLSQSWYPAEREELAKRFSSTAELLISDQSSLWVR